MHPARTAAPLVVITAGGLARETAAAAVAAGREVVGFLDDDPGLAGRELLPGIPVLGKIDAVTEHPDEDLVVCAGKGDVRRRIVARLEALGVGLERYVAVLHPAMSLAPGCVIGPGSVLLAGTVLTADASLGPHVVCMPGVVLPHDVAVEAYATICAGVVLGGSVVVGEAAYIGMAASVREGVTIGAGALIGMGSVVLTDVPPDQTWLGAPAHELVRPAPSAHDGR